MYEQTNETIASFPLSLSPSSAHFDCGIAWNRNVHLLQFSTHVTLSFYFNGLPSSLQKSRSFLQPPTIVNSLLFRHSHSVTNGQSMYVQIAIN